mmetsp:Transcript_132919/g.187817  ORF Transcript_132919/g.187817 Transcript_132919/m.187817 type:complete len:291 (+) Transcript_132919:71-943(+)
MDGFLPVHAKGSIGEKIIIKVFFISIEHALLRRLAQLVYFLVAAPWFIGWWGFTRYVHMFVFFVIRNETFELNYKELLRDIPVKGVLHVGANVGQEAATYDELGVPRVLWVEAQEECREELEQNLRVHNRRHDLVAITAVSSRREEATLYRTDNSISSSLKPLGNGHRSYFPFIEQSSPTKVQTETLDGLLARLSLDPAGFDFMYLDVQGSELDVLQGSRGALGHIRYIMTEISAEEHYKGGCMESDLHDFLSQAGFVRALRQMPPIGHGNALYVRESERFLKGARHAGA